tara:strand:- start:179778 stop:180380 length:603 start_codon:yes stop_codon:yes gene_type:complete
MKNWIFYLLAIGFTASCGSNSDSEGDQTEQVESAEEILTSIQEIDDSLKTMIDKKMEDDSYKVDKIVYHEAINRNKKFFSMYPDHEKAESAVDKIASLYMQIGVQKEAAKWRDTLLAKFPETKNKIGLLEMQLNYYDYDQRDTEKMEYYLEELLKQENLSEEKKESYEFRLKHIDKTFEELIELRRIEDSIANAQNEKES